VAGYERRATRQHARETASAGISPAGPRRAANTMNRKGFVFAALTLLCGIAAAAEQGEFQVSESSDVIGESRVIAARYEDTFVALARTYDLGFEELREANPDVDPWLPGEGTKIVLPTQFVLPDAPRKGIVINLPELRLYYFPDEDGRRVITHPISIGRMDWSTPLGLTRVQSKVSNPAWYPPESIREEHAAENRPLPAVVPPGPDNPLGKHALRLALPGYLIHGTNKPAGVGMRVTHGCIRLFPEDIKALFDNVPVGTPVRIVNQPYKLGWGEGGLYLEAHPPLAENGEERPPLNMTELTRAFVAATENRYGQVDWDLAERIVREGRGTPELVSDTASLWSNASSAAGSEPPN
jgi:L,D-transpeptidase ErfK/SrfK